ncbi:hypothetical protein AWH62_13005 [Maricaulis sp. W15]|uniref:DUF1214 domain-containing protein n=1 Tax=Maricaulis sp. W15 TaxID=1772333 RepID=UPI0009652289|nr:DUF1214 domain-containing protein [Maricaulis sp. W15]OLF71457.1 hypothetical protein AWH62_13005 [Maricaulis sp. W15]
MTLRHVLTFLIGLVCGAVLAATLVFSPIEIGGVSNGPWITNPHIGSSDANPLTRALVARRGLLALTREEAVYFTATRDSNDLNLSERCAYEITGEIPPARWWSITIYDEDSFLPRNGLDRHAVNSRSVDVDGDGRVVIPVGQASPGAIATDQAGLFSLTLRLYHPDPIVLEDLDSLDFPRIERIGCEGDT